MIGPWQHSLAFQQKLGEKDFGPAASNEGAVTLSLFASTSAVDTDFTGKPEPVQPGAIYDFMIGVGQTSIVVAKGQRLRLHVSSSNFPQYDRSMNTGNAIGVDEKGIIAQQTIYHDLNRTSYLELPMAVIAKA